MKWRWPWRRRDALGERLAKAAEQAKRGGGRDRGDFTQYLDDDDRKELIRDIANRPDVRRVLDPLAPHEGPSPCDCDCDCDHCKED